MTIALEDTRRVPSGEGRYYFPSRNIVRVYRISGVDKAPYKTIATHIENLREVLAERPKAIPYDETESSSASAPSVTPRYNLPDYPPRNAAHAIEVKLAYVDANWGAALCYVTQFTQDSGTIINNEELTYIVQGITKDNQFYISADFSITHPKLPKGARDAPERPGADNSADQTFLSKQSEASFTPDLSKLRKWISGLEIE